MCRQCEAPLAGMSTKAIFCTTTCRNRWAARKKRGEVVDPPAECEWCGASVAMRQGGSKFCAARCKNAFHNTKQDHSHRKYGISRDDVLAMAAQQGGCRVCGATEADWVVDHDHECCPGRYTCGKCVRGVLCRNCNSAIGLLGEDAERAVAAAAYLLSTRDVLSMAAH